VAAEPHILFDMESGRRFDAAVRLLGIDFSNLSDTAGHA